MTGPKALLFDVFGTVVDWRSSVISELETFFAPREVVLDWEQFALDWRALYQPAMDAVRSGAREYVALDVLHRENLEVLLARHGIRGLSGDDLWHLTTVWHRLDPWPDCAAGLARLKQQRIVATLSNGNIALMVNLSRHGGLVWDAILGAEIARAYKPDAAVYLRAAEALDLAPGDCMMVAAHNGDLRAARALGLQTAFILRTTEYGPGQTADLKAEEDWDFVTDSLTGLADALA
ncbi:haloacid dehalogenase type II [Pseudoruegeria sp. HB172150]|uniref:haloacid dehalogenase type II n=1 Tax=Pseudoruegeria sp. HB172150 TaxID=2721164 RepID=UPI001555387F|nr:haloacid dehalogenase type II [Pseudoruegeria sp. HB172150]